MDASGALLQRIDTAEAVVDAPQGVGAELQLARIRANLSISDVAAATKISSEYLQAIESMERAALPPRAYALGFVRCYANHLGLDAETMAGSFKKQFYDGLTPMGDLSTRPAPAWVDFRLPKGTGLVLLVVFALGLATWYGLRTPAQTAMVVPPVPEALADWANSKTLGDVPDMSISYVTMDGS
jgi:cytoskeleton protein RodZ